MKPLHVNGIDFQEKDGKTYVHMLQTGVECTYLMPEAKTKFPIKYLLMDLDGTTAKSEEFWMLLIEKTLQEILHEDSFRLAKEDIPFVSGYSTQEHLSYCLNKYHIDYSLPDALALYHKITHQELDLISKGQGYTDAMKPRQGLKEFLLEIHKHGIKIGLATSGLDYKAIPEISSAFHNIGMGDPLDYYDAIITGGRQKLKGQYGTIGELAVKPHPWVYAELGLGLDIQDKSEAIVLEDSSAGVISGRVAGYNAIGFKDGNLLASGVDQYCLKMVDTLDEVLSILLGK